MKTASFISKLFMTVFLSATLLAPNLSAQSVWSLEKCIEYALENNIQVKQAGLAIDFNHNLLERSKNERLPNFNAQLNNDYNFGRSLTFQNTFENTNSVSVGAGLGGNVVVWNGSVMQNNVMQRELDLRASTYDLQKVKDDIALAVAAHYLEILFAQELEKIDESQIEITIQQLDRVRTLVEAGGLPIGATLETEAQKAREEYQLVNSRNRVRLAYLNLFQLLELPPDKTFKVEAPDYELVEILGQSLDASMVFDRARQNRPEIQASLLRVQSAQKQVEIARAGAYPRITLGANYYNNFSDNFTEAIGGDPLNRQVIPFFTQLKNNQRYGVGINVSIPIFNGFQTRTNVSNARIQVLENEYRLQSALNSLQKDIEQAYTNAISARQRYIASQKAVDAGQEAFRYIEARHNNGLATTVEFNQVKNDLAAAQSQQLQAKFDFIFRSKILDFYNGIPISL